MKLFLKNSRVMSTGQYVLRSGRCQPNKKQTVPFASTAIAESRKVKALKYLPPSAVGQPGGANARSAHVPLQPV
jgi:hypothetical protein